MSDTTLLSRLRSMGLPMRGSMPPHEHTTLDEAGEVVVLTAQRWYGWTTDKAKADAAAEAGAIVSAYRATDPRFNGWEVSVSEVVGG